MNEPTHTRAMGEIGEMPQGPLPEQAPPQQRRLEDMPEFQKLAPEQQQKLLELRERMMAEAMEPKQVVSRSINEMGFWEGLKETTKPHLEKQKKIMFNELKANASLAISLIPVIGEGKGLGTGLLGITVTKGAPVETAIKFEPLIRGKKAVELGKRGYSFIRGETAASKLMKFKTTDSSVLVRAAMKGADAVDMAAAHVKDIPRVVRGGLGAKTAVERSLIKGFNASAKEGAKVMMKNFGVEGIQAAQQAKKAEKLKAYAAVKTAVKELNAADKEWYKFPLRWARSAGGEVGARVASETAGKVASEAVKNAVNESVKSTSKVGKFVEGGVKQMAPKAIELTKFGQFKAFAEKWLDFTPDVPVWLSTTTGVLEFLGMHGVDALPAMMQMGINRYKSAMVGKDMALDVLGYTVKRAMGISEKQKQAAQMFRNPTMAPAMG